MADATDETADEDTDLLDLEHAGWRSLCERSGSEFYGTMMTSDARMVLANGTVMTRDEVVESLRHAPAWDSYEIDDPVIVPLDEDVAALVYTGTGHRGDQTFVGVMTSVYAWRDGAWRLAIYQQTPAETS